jgi:hypothetical protein
MAGAISITTHRKQITTCNTPSLRGRVRPKMDLVIAPSQGNNSEVAIG